MKYLPFLLFLLACGPKPDDQKAAPPPPTPVTLATARVAPAVYYNDYPATATALNVVELRAQVGGFVTGIFFREGEVVPKGKLLYELDQRQYQDALRQAQANLAAAQASAANARTNAARYQRLAAQDAVAKQLLDNANTTAATAQAQVAAAAAGVSAARTSLGFARLTAPFAGRIGLSQVRLGAQVGAGSTLLNTISSEDPMGVDFVVTDTDLPRFVALQKAPQKAPSAVPDSALRLVLPNGRAYPLPGRLRVIDRGVNAQTGTTTVRVEFANPQRLLRDGTSLTLRVLNTQSGQRLLVPYKAIVEQMGENFVYVATDSSTARQRKVTLGPRLQDQIVLLTGVRAGEKVVSEGVQKLKDGGRISF